MWELLKDELVLHGLHVCLDIVFHTELDQLPSSYLVELLGQKLAIAVLPGVLVDNNVVTVSANNLDAARFRHHLSRFLVRAPGPQIDELVIGNRDPNRRISSFVSGEHTTING